MNYEVISVLLGALLLVSESLGGIKVIADNSIYQVIVRLLKSFKQFFTSKPAELKNA